VSERSADTLSAVLVVLGLVCGIVAFVFRPFLFGALGTLLVSIAMIATPRQRSLVGIAMLVVGAGFLVGASIAAGTGRDLY
jgi:hypothetical protein